ncbi:hypothetical protein AMJ57_02290 [Parcubacteria bacterium SG8_24]|nr:MAG: hypothetical protein AMJ57_02290 [Parcubacteria bacterium SG8_24]
MGHNQQLDTMLAQIRQTAEGAREEKDFDSIFATLREFRDAVGPIRYDNRSKWYVCAALAVLGGGFALAFFLNPALQRALDIVGYGILGALALALIVVLLVIAFANSSIGQISDLIFRKDVFFDNRLQEQDIEGRGRDMYEHLYEEFGEFRCRGDEDRYIERLIRGQWSGREHSFPYEHYVFHYVRVYYVPVTKKIGKTTITTMERRTQTLHRYGLLLDFPFAERLAVHSSGGDYDYPVRHEPTSEDFNRVFTTVADSEHAAVKFLKPAVVLEFLEMSRMFSGLNLEVGRNGRMNVAFSDSDSSRSSSIEDPDAFEAEVKSDLALPKLRRLMTFVETLKRYNDSNF